MAEEGNGANQQGSGIMMGITLLTLEQLETDQREIRQQPDLELRQIKQIKKTEEKTFTQDELNAILAKEKRKFLEEKNLTSEQLPAKENAELKEEKAERESAEGFISKAENSGAVDPKVVFLAMRKDMEFEKGKLTNYEAVIKLAKQRKTSITFQTSQRISRRRSWRMQTNRQIYE